MIKNYTKYFATVFFVFVSLLCCFAQDVVISTQAEMDAFDSSTTIINGYLYIDGTDSNDPIINLNNFSNLTSVGGDFKIIDNDALTNLNGLSNLSSIGEGLEIKNNDLANLDGLSNLALIEKYLYIQENENLTNIDGLSNLTIIGGALSISLNHSLTNIDGLSNVTFIGRDLTIIQNHNLTNLDGLSNVTIVDGNLRIQNNQALTDCCGIQNLLNTPGSIASNIIISNNPSECNNQNEIVNSCSGTSVVIVDLNGKALGFNLSPNPTANSFQINIEGNTELLDVIIYNSLSQEILSMKMRESTLVNVETWTNGVYFVLVHSKDGKNWGIEKMVKL